MTQGNPSGSDDGSNGGDKPSDDGREIALAIDALSKKYDASQKERADHDRKTLLWAKGATFGVAIYTLITLGIAVVALLQLQTSRDTEQRQLRAYIILDAATITQFEEGKLIKAHVVLKNTGQTPAYDIEGYTAIMYDKFPLPYAFPVVSKEQFGLEQQRSVVGTGGVVHLFVPTKDIPTTDTFSAIRDGTMAVYVFGRLTYRDAFGMDKFTHWRLVYTKPDNSGGLLSPLGKEGNESN